jgi:hypothetical protein
MRYFCPRLAQCRLIDEASYSASASARAIAHVMIWSQMDREQWSKYDYSK